MAGKKDKIVVCVMSDLTEKQASELTSSIIRQKQRIAPLSRGTAAVTDRNKISSLLQSNFKKLRGT